MSGLSAVSSRALDIMASSQSQTWAVCLGAMNQFSRGLFAGVIMTGCASTSDPSPVDPSPAEPVTADDAAKTPTAGWKAKLSQIDKLSYHFQDSSVPPQYHRSVTIVVTPAEVTKVVDSYGDIISEQANAITAAQFKTLLATLEPLGVDVASAPSPSPSNGCTGGTSDSLSLYVASTEVLSGTVSSCGGESVGPMHGDLKQVAKNAAALLVEDPSGPVPTKP